jgi:hypothetical protein
VGRPNPRAMGSLGSCILAFFKGLKCYIISCFEKELNWIEK